ncbi:type II toxin-antitoxin system VapC family toxin [Psychroflexus sediminis]|uniref:Predicted nucleic acid-binding protein, contains PIN domain n=1 Tax=Psychroflexus sediminis TaxID=470826 RepID=A0A1G7YUC8_9FLAO|nr:PIN domain-containing protein [Psychroflexus sediminis]SDH00081.1 Predicted nucleic acid-binding protein, contains PIN domain [Psychroflexus sediminis]
MKRRIFLDTNIMLDFLGERHPFYDSVAKIATLAEKGELVMVVSPISFATVNYFLTKFENPKIAKEKLRKFKIICEICSLNEQTIEKGLNSSIKDFEDALQYFSATESNCDLILTRNAKDFKKSLLPVMTADEFLKSLMTK